MAKIKKMTENKKVFLINPSSSGGNGRKVWEELEKDLQQKGEAYEAILLKAPGEAKQAVKRLIAAGRPCKVIVVGGDGTINEVFNALREGSVPEDLTLGCVPTGSGNDFMRGLQPLPGQRNALLNLSEGTDYDSKRIDIGLVCLQTGNGKGREAAFAVSSGLGYDAQVCYEVERSRLKAFLNRIHMGSLVYTLVALKLLLTMKPVKMRVTLDGGDCHTFEKTWFAAAMNTPCEGGGYRFCPDADPGDGKLDLIVAEGIGRLRVIFLMPCAQKGRHVGKRGIHLYRAKEIRVETARPSCVHTDGEYLCFTKEAAWKLKGQQVLFEISRK